MATSTTTPTPGQFQAIINGPAGRPPAGVTPNFHNPSSLNRFVAPILTLCITFTTLAILTRMYTKKFLIKSWAYEDCRTLVPYPRKPITTLTLARRSYNGMGKYWLTGGSLFSLTKAVWPNYTDCYICSCCSARWWHTYMEYTDEKLLYNAICRAPPPKKTML